MMTMPALGWNNNKFMPQVQWLATNAANLQLKFVAQVGDLVNGRYKTTLSPTVGKTEWTMVKEAMDLLATANVPWGVALGNHDMDNWCWTDGTADRPPGGCTVTGIAGSWPNNRAATYFNAQFPYSYFDGMTSTFGTMEANKSDNMYHRITVNTATKGTKNFLIIALKWDPTTLDFDWATKIINTYPTDKVILMLHSYNTSLGTPSTSSNGGTHDDAWTKLVSTNPRILLVLSGHESRPRSPTNYNATTGTANDFQWIRYQTTPRPGDPNTLVHQILTDYSYHNSRPEPYAISHTHNGKTYSGTARKRITDQFYFRLLKFDVAQNKIFVETIAAPTTSTSADTSWTGLLNPTENSTEAKAACSQTTQVGTSTIIPVCSKADESYGADFDTYEITDSRIGN